MNKLRADCLLLITYLLLLGLGSKGQAGFSIGLKAGISIPNLQSSVDNPVSDGWSSRQGPYMGIIAEMSLDKNFFLQGELNYSSQGGKKNGLQAIPVLPEYAPFFPAGIPVPDYLYANYNSEAKLNYLELPIMLKYDHPISAKFSLFANAGPYLGYLIGAKNITSGASNIYLDSKLTVPLLPEAVSFDSDTDIKDEIVKFNFGVQAGIGFSYHFINGSKLLLTGGVNYGLTHIQKDPANGENNTGAGTITLGYLIGL